MSWIESPYDELKKEDMIKLFSRFGLSSVLFFTVPPKINTPKELPDMSRIVRSLRPYVDAMFIVRGMNSGRHYHGLMHLIPGKVLPKFTKFHLNIKTLVNSNNNFDHTDVESKDKAEYFNTLKIDGNLNNGIIDSILKHSETARVVAPEVASVVCRALSEMIKSHFKQKQNAVKARQKKTKKEFHIGSVYDYLTKNLNENDFQKRYQTHQLINLFPKKIRIKDIVTTEINSGIISKYDNKNRP